MLVARGVSGTISATAASRQVSRPGSAGPIALLLSSEHGETATTLGRGGDHRISWMTEAGDADRGDRKRISHLTGAKDSGPSAGS